MTSANNPKNEQPHGLGNLAQIIDKGVLYELEMAHRIIRNALSLMSTVQKEAWGRKNECDGLIDFGITRANEREAAIKKATCQLSQKES